MRCARCARCGCFRRRRLACLHWRWVLAASDPPAACCLIACGMLRCLAVWPGCAGAGEAEDHKQGGGGGGGPHLSSPLSSLLCLLELPPEPAAGASPMLQHATHHSAACCKAQHRTPHGRAHMPALGRRLAPHWRPSAGRPAAAGAAAAASCSFWPAWWAAVIHEVMNIARCWLGLPLLQEGRAVSGRARQQWQQHQQLAAGNHLRER